MPQYEQTLGKAWQRQGRTHLFELARCRLWTCMTHVNQELGGGGGGGEGEYRLLLSHTLRLQGFGAGVR